MSIESIAQLAGVWVAQYLAGFSLFTIVIWAIISYMRLPRWERAVRDAGIFFLIIGTLTLVLALRPTRGDVLLWNPITWFSFTMLLVMELLWLALLGEMIYQAMISVPSKVAPRSKPHYPSNSPTR